MRHEGSRGLYGRNGQSLKRRQVRAQRHADPPALRICPGDSVHTTTVDAGGTDENGVTRVLGGGNPDTGPFYVETAMPGDVNVVRLNRLRLNRDWAISDDGIVGRAALLHH